MKLTGDSNHFPIQKVTLIDL